MTLTERLARVKLLCCDWDGCFTDNHVYTFADGSEAVRTSRADGIGIKRLQALGIPVIVLTGEPPFYKGRKSIAAVRCEKLGIPIFHGEPKLPLLEQSAAYYRVSLGEAAYVGNDVNDLDCLGAVGFPFLVADHDLKMIPAPLCLMEYGTTSRAGGDAAVREVCDAIADAIEQHKPNLQRVAGALS